jgi:hypothetical protein
MSDAGRSSTKRIALAISVVFLVLTVGLVAVQVLPPTGPTYAVGMCLSGQVSDTDKSVIVAPCERAHQYVVVKIIDPDVTLSTEICPATTAAFIEFEAGGLEQKLRHVFGDRRVELQFACLQASP